jgi:hypothetical protein
MSESPHTLTSTANTLQELAQLFYQAAKTASQRIQGNLRLEALQKATSVTERFWAYMEMGLDGQQIGELVRLKVTAIAFTDRGEAAQNPEVTIGADMACFVRYDLPGLRWAKGFLGQSQLATLHGFHPNGAPKVGLASPQAYDLMVQQCAAMGNVTDESYVFFFSPEAVTVEKANNLLGDMGEAYPIKPWQDLHQFRHSPPVNIAQFYGAMAACQLGEAMLDRPIKSGFNVLDLIKTHGIQTVLVLMVGTTPPQKPLKRHSAEAKAMPIPVPETYWLFPELVQTLIQRSKEESA